jgi:transcriptional regulator with XRE-family HTH domain
MKKTLGTRIRELRDAKDLSLRELAKKLDDISAAHLSDIELGRRNPSEELMSKLARVLGVPVEDLQQYDARPPIEDMKKRIRSDPAFGIALRKLMGSDVSTQKIMELAEKKSEPGSKK